MVKACVDMLHVGGDALSCAPAWLRGLRRPRGMSERYATPAAPSGGEGGGDYDGDYDGNHNGNYVSEDDLIQDFFVATFELSEQSVSGSASACG